MLDFIEAEAAVRGILTHHCRVGYHCEGNPGLPDLILAGSHRVAFWELKQDYGQLSSAQRQWDWKLRACGYRIRLVTPSELPRIPEYLDGLNNE